MKFRNTLLLIFFSYIFVQPVFSDDFLSINSSSNSLEFSTNIDNSFSLTVQNLSQIYQIRIDSLKLANPHYNLLFTYENVPLNIEAGKTSTLSLKVNSKHNIDYNLNIYVYYTVKDLNQSLVSLFNEHLKFKYNDLYDEFTQNFSSLDLKKKLSDYLSTHTSLTYKDARQNMFGHIDNVDGWVECVYTGRKIQTTGIPDVNTTKFNNEHTWPQSQGADYEPPKSDIYHMYPTDETANAKRGDFPFGYVASNIVWEQGGSKLGKDINGYTVFEPRDVHKGNVARSMFYFAIAYNNPFNYLNQQESTLRKWMDVDPIDDRERYRNDEIAKLQGKRNPFIDHPEFLERIYSISTNDIFPNIPSLETPMNQIDISTNYLASNNSYNLYITNTGIYPLVINSIELINSDNKPLIVDFNKLNDIQLASDSTLKITLKLQDDINDDKQENTLLIHYNSNQNTKQITFKELFINSISQKELIQKLIIHSQDQNTFQLQIPEIFRNENVNISIFDIYGRKIYTSSSNFQNVITFNLNQSDGLFFIQIANTNNQITEPIIIVK
ncbi:MAG: endonuclease [Candidatus Kapaibacteriota bacterium]